ncbi:MAG: calcium/sodium antiporter [Rikenellaceae bacterium]|nr:calcium/sodium antiporter [Rikenellaceae bacterium]
MDYLILIGSLALIIIGAMMLTDGSVALAGRFRVPEFVVGLTIVAIGTSMPELAVSFFAALEGSADISIGNVVGSNVFNVYAALGVCGLFAPMLFTRSNVRRDIPLCIAISALFLIVVATGGNINRTEGIILLASYIAMLYFTIRADRKCLMEQSCEVDDAPTMPIWRIVVWIVGGLLGLIYGGQYCVESASAIARSLGVSEATIAITLIAGGTSLPELASSLVSILRGSPSLALGNILGSNIANILLILGVCSTITPLQLGDVTMVDIAIAVSAPVALLITALIIGRNKLTRIESLAFLAIYAVYVYFLI